MSTSLTTIVSSAAALACISLSNSVNAADLSLHKVPALTVDQAPAYPQNLARTRLGAHIEETVTDAKIASGEAARVNADALLSADPAKGVALPAGTTSVTIALSSIENVDTISFVSSAKGTISISAANGKLPLNSPQWKSVVDQQLSDAVTAKVGPMEAKYIRLKFELTEPGRVAGLGVYSTNAVSDFTMPRASKAALNQTFGYISANVTDMHQRARALYVSSGSNVKDANNMIDDRMATSYAFNESDAAPTTIVDLGRTTSLCRISAAYTSRGGKVDFYVLANIPGAVAANADTAPANLHIKDSDLHLVGSFFDDGSGRAAIDFPETTGRYVMVKWTPAQTSGNLSVAEVAAFGGREENDVLASNKTHNDSSDGKTMIDSKDMGDAKDMPGEGPEDTPGEGPDNAGPGLPQPPPFVFIPEVLPVSQ